MENIGHELKLAKRAGIFYPTVTTKKKVPTSRDRLTKARRSWNMSRIKGKNTTPEKRVRSLLHQLGYRFRLHPKIPLPGRTNSASPKLRYACPDLVLPKYKTVIFVHGCFWHRHPGCQDCTTPTHNREFWLKKLEANAARDKVKQRALKKLGWRVIVVWECETKNAKSLERLNKRLIYTV